MEVLDELAVDNLETPILVEGRRDVEALRVLGGTTYLGSSAKAEAELGFAARPLEEGLREMLGGIPATLTPRHRN
jgi:hypothetical protein